MATHANFLNWDTQQDLCCERIARNPATLKILLKTKNDPFFLERWIAHHHKIAGDGNIVIFDNMSDDPAVSRIYRKYQDVITVVFFEGNHNAVHKIRLFSGLYRSLSKAADFFAFLDTDEFLVLFDGDRYFKDEYLLEFIKQNRSCDVFPAAWLHNVDRSATRFACGVDFSDLMNRVAWGKPILRSKAKLWGFINHNCQVDKSLFSVPFRTNFFVLHMTHLLPEQRIVANVNKLIALGFAKPGDNVEKIGARNLENISDPNALRYINEIRYFVSEGGSRLKDNMQLRSGCLELLADGHIRFYSNRERNILDELMGEPGQAHNELVASFSASYPFGAPKAPLMAWAQQIYRRIARPPNSTP